MAIKYKLHLLGSVMVTWETAEPPRFRSQLTMALLGYLAAEQRPVARDALATLFWPDEPLSTGKANLRRELHNLSNILPGCWQTDRQIIALVPDRGTKVDIYDLLALEAAENWLETADLIRGEFLEGLYLEDNIEFETWLLGERERWRQRAERVLRRAVEDRINVGDDTEALRHARRLLRLLPWHEEMHRQVMTLLAQRGQRSVALQQFEQCKELLREELGVDVSAETQALYERIRDTATFTLHNIPAQTTPLIGREEELSFLNDWLADPDIRLVTITGPGGIGKTRLAMEVAHQLVETFKDGVVFVNLAPLSSEEAIVPAVAQTLRFRIQDSDRREPKTQLLDYLGNKELLLVLDNFEHLLNAAPLLTEILQAASAVKLFATSREQLKLQVEHVYPLQGLAFREWETTAEAHDDPAVQLFLHHAQRLRPSFTLRAEHLEPLQEIFRLVGGMPLAVILAAGWMKVLSLGAIATEIGHNLDALEAPERDIPERHRSMRAIFDMTWQRLSKREQAQFAALSVFRGGFTGEAGRAVAGANPRDLLILVDRSLLSRVEGGRFEVHELLRQFAAERLSQAPKKEKTVREEHSRYFCQFLQTREEELKGPRGQEAEDEIAVELQNVHLAWAWAIEYAVEMVYQAQTAFLIFFERQGRWQEGETAVMQAKAILEKRDEVDARRMAELFAWVSHWVRYRSFETAEELLRQATVWLTKAEAQGKDVRNERAFILHSRGLIARTRNQSESQALLKQSLSLYQKLGRHWEMAWVQYSLGGLYVRQAKYRKANEQFHRSIELLEMVEDKKMVNWPRMSMALSMAAVGRLDEAEMMVHEALTYGETTGDERTTAWALSSLGYVLNLSGRFEEALLVLDESQGQFANLGQKREVRFCRSDRCLSALHLGCYEEVLSEIEPMLDSGLESSEDAVYLQARAGFPLGSASLALGNLDEARAHLYESLRFNQAIRDRSEVANAQAVLGHMAIHAGDQALAQKHMVEAMSLRLFLACLLSLPAAALLMAEVGRPKQAVELYALASRYEFVANSRWFEDVAGRRITALAMTLPGDEVAAAKDRGGARDLWETVEELLEQLKRMNL